MFDLPMDTSNEKRQYRTFRKSLKINGFSKVQYSVYCRAIQNRSAGKKYISALSEFLPEHGEVRLIAVSEKQYNDMKILVGHRSKQETIIGNKDLVII